MRSVYEKGVEGERRDSPAQGIRSYLYYTNTTVAIFRTPYE